MQLYGIGKWRKPLTLFVVIFYRDDLSSCGSGMAQNGGSIQRLDGEWINYTNVLSCKRKMFSDLYILAK